MKVGRNDPCPCGSGKKYKKCCLEREKLSDLGYRRLSNAQQELVKKLTGYAVHEIGQSFVSGALIDFFQDDSEDPEDFFQLMMDEFSSVFWPWLFFTVDFGKADIEDLGMPGYVRPNMTVAEMYMQDKDSKLDPLELELLSVANRTQFSFYEAVAVQPGQGFQAKDLLTGQMYMVSDVLASQDLEQGDILYALIIEVQGYAISIGSASYKLYPRFKPEIIQFRKELEEDFGSVTNGVLMEVDSELRDFFMALQQALFEMPEMCNTDGDPLSFRTLHYEIDSPEDAFQSLAPLCVHQTEEELRDQAELDEKSQVQAVRFAWSREGHTLSKGLDNTTLGHIRIEGDRMTIEVNSEAREERIKEEIDKRLGEKATYKVTDIRSLESVMAEGSSETPSWRQDEAEQEALSNSPEVQEAIRGVLGQHWEGWLDSELPALGGKTPRQAVQTEDGREAVQALLRDVEISDKSSNMPVSQQPYVDWARKELGLPDT